MAAQIPGLVLRNLLEHLKIYYPFGVGVGGGNNHANWGVMVSH